MFNDDIVAYNSNAVSGIYIPKNKLEVPEEFRGIGVRIEDDILITETGFEVLSRDCPRRVQEIEELCS